jgi:hypothetical protein
VQDLIQRLADLWLRKSRRRELRLVVGILILIGGFAFLGYAAYLGWDTLKAHLREFNYWFLGLAVLCYPLGFAPTIWNWHVIMSRVGDFNSVRKNARAYCLSCLPKRIPGVIWYIGSRIALYREHEVGAPATLAATGIETITLVLSGISVYIVASGVGSLTMHSTLRHSAIAALILALTAPLWAPALYRGIRKVLARVGISVSVEFSSFDVLYLLGISTLAWAGGGWILYLVANAVTAVPLGELPNLIGIWGAAGAVSLVAGLLIQGMGLREVTLALLLRRFMPLPLAAVVSVLFRLLLMVGEVLWALVVTWLARESAR